MARFKHVLGRGRDVLIGLGLGGAIGAATVTYVADPAAVSAPPGVPTSRVPHVPSISQLGWHVMLRGESPPSFGVDFTMAGAGDLHLGLVTSEVPEVLRLIAWAKAVAARSGAPSAPASAGFINRAVVGEAHGQAGMVHIGRDVDVGQGRVEVIPPLAVRVGGLSSEVQNLILAIDRAALKAAVRSKRK